MAKSPSEEILAEDPVAHTEPQANTRTQDLVANTEPDTQTLASEPHDDLMSDTRLQPPVEPAVLQAHATRAASTTATDTPDPPTAILDNPAPPKGLDPRLELAHDLARRGLAWASVNDLAKAVLLLLDVATYTDPKKSPVGQAAARGEAPNLL